MLQSFVPWKSAFNLTSFGALNNSKYGHRRLNVLITRARKRVVVFSSIDPGEIAVSPNNSWGVRALKDYLAYAKTGVLDQPRDTGREPDSEFEIVVADALRKRGFIVVPQVGVASYRIDLAVRHPEKPGSYILGVECDGATYHSSRSARDRDRLRQAVLEGLGWNIHRIWSTDWFRNREKEIDKVVNRITELLQRA
jgi:very-short-patch-repair endonuclease